MRTKPFVSLRRTQDTWCTQFPLCLRKKPTNFGSWRIVCEPFANSTAQVRIPSTHTLIWFALCTRLYRRFTKMSFTLPQSTVYPWHKQLQDDRESSALRDGTDWLVIATMETMVNTVAVVKEDQQLEVTQIAAELHLLKSIVHQILTQHLKTCRLCST